MILKTNLFFVFLSLMFLSAYGQKQIKVKKLEGYNGQVYFKKEPLNGCYRLKRYSWLKEVSTFIDGKREGSASRFVRGKLEKTTNYKNGKKEGEEITYGCNDKIKKVSNYRNDLLNGLQLTYFSSQKLSSKAFYENGEMKHSINYFVDGNIQKECSFNNGDGFCVRFQAENSKNSDYKIIDSLFYKDERIINMKTFFNGNIDSEIKVNYEKDTTERFSEEVLTISFYKLKTFQEAYVFYLNEFVFSFTEPQLVNLIINSYESSYQSETNEIINSYISPCSILINNTLTVDDFYVKKEKSIYKVVYYDDINDTRPRCYVRLMKNNGVQ